MHRAMFAAVPLIGLVWMSGCQSSHSEPPPPRVESTQERLYTAQPTYSKPLPQQGYEMQNPPPQFRDAPAMGQNPNSQPPLPGQQGYVPPSNPSAPNPSNVPPPQAPSGNGGLAPNPANPLPEQSLPLAPQTQPTNR